MLTGDETADLQRIAAIYAGARGKRPLQPTPVRLLEMAPTRSDTIIR
jgi:hypothetical protein